MLLGYWWESQKERDHWEHNIKMYLIEVGRNGMDWIYMAQDRDQWKALVNTVLNPGFHEMLGSS
jgi:hypothetical protein